MLNQFSNLFCYEEFEIQCTLTGISKIDILRKIGHKVNDYYFFVSEDGIFNWYNLKGNYIENPGVLKSIYKKYIPETLTKCIIPDGVTRIIDATFSHCKSLKEINIPNSVVIIYPCAFANCDSLKEITIPDSVTSIGNDAFSNCDSKTDIAFSVSFISLSSLIRFL